MKFGKTKVCPKCGAIIPNVRGETTKHFVEKHPEFAFHREDKAGGGRILVCDHCGEDVNSFRRLVLKHDHTTPKQPLQPQQFPILRGLLKEFLELFTHFEKTSELKAELKEIASNSERIVKQVSEIRSLFLISKE